MLTHGTILVYPNSRAARLAARRQPRTRGHAPVEMRINLSIYSVHVNPIHVDPIVAPCCRSGTAAARRRPAGRV